ncbi:lysophospholipid acyltransferase family protein [Rothia sp. LK2588]|uniref:lysophospholipid acyltransferase family protein n=1 Tax=Rothia sp. LK2588 TaxID=3114369 RepID=UPI0034CF6D9C
MLYMTLKKTVVGPLMRALYDHEVIGVDNLPTGGAIIASNHLAFCDSVFIPLAVPRQVFFLAKSDYFTGKGPYGAAVRWFFNAVGQLPMDRSGGRKSQASLDAGTEKLREGGLIGIYPEGTRSPDGKAYRVKVGVARLALSARVPVVPVGQIGTDDAQPSGSNAVKLRKDGKKIKVTTIIGEPLDFSEYYDRAHDRQVQREVADRIGAAIRELSQQEYVPVYASAVKDLMKERNISAEEAQAILLSQQPSKEV